MLLMLCMLLLVLPLLILVPLVLLLLLLVLPLLLLVPLVLLVLLPCAAPLPLQLLVMHATHARAPAGDALYMMPGGSPRGARDIGDPPFDRVTDPLMPLVNLWSQSPLGHFCDYKYNGGAGTLVFDQERLLAEIDDAAVVKPEVVAKCMGKYAEMMSCATRLSACAVCATAAFDFPDTAAHVPFRVGVSDALEILRLNEQDIDSLRDIPRRLRPARSFYPRPGREDPLPEVPLYWLDPKLVSPGGVVMACGLCAAALNAGECVRAGILLACACVILMHLSHAGVRPTICIATGYDWGDPDAIGLSRPSLAEAVAISMERTVSANMNLFTEAPLGKSFCHTTGYAVTFEQSDAPAAVLEARRLPDIDRLRTQLRIVLTGPDGVPCSPDAAIGRGRPLHIKAWLVYAWLDALKWLNPYYRDVEITPGLERELEALPHVLYDAAVLARAHVSELGGVNMDRHGSSSSDSDVSEEEAAPRAPRVPVPTLDAIDRALLAANSNLVFSVEALQLGSEIRDRMDSAVSQSQLFESVQRALGHDVDKDATVTELPVQLDRAADPANSYTLGRRSLYRTYPYVWLLGQGLGAGGSAVLPIALRVHMLAHASKRVATNAQLLFMLEQRKSLAESAYRVKARVRAHPVLAAAFVAKAKTRGFAAELRNAAAHPNTPASRALHGTLQKFVVVPQARVPYSAFERSACKGEMYALTEWCGPPAWFISIALDERWAHLTVRLSTQLARTDANGKSPATFRADLFEIPSDEFASCTDAEWGRRGDGELPAVRAQWRRHLSRSVMGNPVAAALMAHRTIRCIIQCLFCIALPDATRVDPAPAARFEKGVLGRASTYYFVVESQDRFALHFHGIVNAGVPAWLQQRISQPGLGGDFAAALQAKVVEALDSVCLAQLPGGLHFQNLVSMANGVVLERPAMTAPPEPPVDDSDATPLDLDNSGPAGADDFITLYAERITSTAYHAVLSAGIHTHSCTCEKGKLGRHMCRVCRPVIHSLTTRTHQIDLLTRCLRADVEDYACDWTPEFLLHRPGQPDLTLQASPYQRVRDSRLLVVLLERPLIDVRAYTADDRLLRRVLLRVEQHLLVVDTRAGIPRVLCHDGASVDELAAHVMGCPLARPPLVAGSDAELRALPKLTREALLMALVFRNGSVADTCPSISAATGSNVACYYLGSIEAAMASMHYLTSYLSKDCFELGPKMLPLVTNAARYMRLRPAAPADPAPPGGESPGLRNALYLFQRIGNMAGKARKRSVEMSAANLLGLPNQFTNVQFWYVFHVAWAATIEAERRTERGEGPGGVTSAWADAEALAPSGGVDDDVESEPDVSRLHAQEARAAADDALRRTDAFADSGETGLGGTGASELQFDAKGAPFAAPQHVYYDHRPTALLDVAFVEFTCAFDIIRISDLDKRGRERARLVLAAAGIRMAAAAPSAAAARRARGLAPAAAAAAAAVPPERDDDDAPAAQADGASARSNALYAFQKAFPLARTHVVRTRSKTVVPYLAGRALRRIPVLPAGELPSATFLTLANASAEAILCLCKPTPPAFVADDSTVRAVGRFARPDGAYATLCRYMNELRLKSYAVLTRPYPPPAAALFGSPAERTVQLAAREAAAGVHRRQLQVAFRARVLHEYMESLCIGTTRSHAARTAHQRFRGVAATRWGGEDPEGAFRDICPAASRQSEFDRVGASVGDAVMTGQRLERAAHGGDAQAVAAAAAADLERFVLADADAGGLTAQQLSGRARALDGLLAVQQLSDKYLRMLPALPQLGALRRPQLAGRPLVYDGAVDVAQIRANLNDHGKRTAQRDVGAPAAAVEPAAAPVHARDVAAPAAAALRRIQRGPRGQRLSPDQAALLARFADHIDATFAHRRGVRGAAAPPPLSVALDGPAGTGKTHVARILREIAECLRVRGGGDPVVLCCTTAIGARHLGVGAVTAHNVAGLGWGDGDSRNAVRVFPLSVARVARLRAAHYVLLDEKSMMCARFVSSFSGRCQEARGGAPGRAAMPGWNLAFGGLSMCLSGDYNQARMPARARMRASCV